MMAHLRLWGLHACLLKHDGWRNGETLHNENENHKIELTYAALYLVRCFISFQSLAKSHR